ncbi:MAG TPA: DHHA1 domain-containing protein [Thermoanaerobaculia bacterium]|nr:DHHA1 domain-containing protein [Thermoanaerobaculia bacterium]
MISDRTKEKFAELETRVRSGTGRWLVLTHDSPDPDAIASATILARLLRSRFKQKVTIAHGGIIGRAENKEMVRALHLELSRMRHINLKHYRRFALVDTQPRTGNNQLPDHVVPDLVFDHHFLRKATQSCPFFDVRRDYSATASLVTEYLLAAGIEPTHREATAVVYAIRSETLDFARDTLGPDRALYEHLLARADRRMLGRIQTPRLPVGYFTTLHEALENLQTVDSLILSHLGRIEQPDSVPELADLLLRLEGKTWSLVTGVFEDRIYCSIRTTNPRAEAAHVMRRMVGRRGKGGGHGMLAGGWVAAPDTPEAIARLQIELGVKLARLLKKSSERISPLNVERAPATPATATTGATTAQATAPAPAAAATATKPSAKQPDEILAVALDVAEGPRSD